MFVNVVSYFIYNKNELKASINIGLLSFNLVSCFGSLRLRTVFFVLYFLSCLQSTNLTSYENSSRVLHYSIRIFSIIPTIFSSAFFVTLFSAFIFIKPRLIAVFLQAQSYFNYLFAYSLLNLNFRSMLPNGSELQIYNYLDLQAFN